MRYEVCPLTLVNHTPTEESREPAWCVFEGIRRVSVPTTIAAEANIIAFALNAVAEGHCLIVADPHSDDEDTSQHYELVEYTGPTEGVAP